MFANLQIDDVLFLDIETVPLAPSLEKLDETMQKLWDKKSRNFRLPDQTAADVYERAGIYSEFGKIICISVGFIKTKDPFSIRLKSFYNDD